MHAYIAQTQACMAVSQSVTCTVEHHFFQIDNAQMKLICLPRMACIYNKCLQDMHQDIQDVLGQNFGIPDDIDEDELMEELDALEDDLAADTEANADGVPSYLQVHECCVPLTVLLLYCCACSRQGLCSVISVEGW